MYGYALGLLSTVTRVCRLKLAASLVATLPWNPLHGDALVAIASWDRHDLNMHGGICWPFDLQTDPPLASTNSATVPSTPSQHRGELR